MPSKKLINSWFKCNKDNCDRSSLLEKSIHYIDEETPIKIKDILKTFIKYHEGIPLFILCKNVILSMIINV